MVKKVYIDTSVVGAYYDKEFKYWTKLFFNSVERGEFKLAISEILYAELSNAPLRIREILQKIQENNKIYVEYNSDARKLADEYLNSNVVGHKSITDCRHIATATVNQVEVLASWNFKHIVNLNKIHLYNGVNIQQGYKSIEIRTPREILNYENR
ncbi:MAG: PIN domain-containing protein [Chitinophagales bacterium]